MLSKAHRMIGRFLATFGLLLISVQAGRPLPARHRRKGDGTRKCGHQDDGDSDALVVGTCDALDHDQFCSNFGRSDALTATALGTQTSPPRQALMELSLFLTVAIMWPVGSEMYKRGLQYRGRQISSSDALVEASKPLRIFMLRQTREKDLSFSTNSHRQQSPRQWKRSECIS